MRQLAAIVFADMTGYTALMQENEQLARAKRKRLKDVLEETIVRYNGKVLQYYGDGSLSMFSSAIDSVRCSIDIQQQLQQTEPRVELRMGIHTGDVTIEEESIYGDGVNLASRIESMAVPGGILVSEKVFDEIRNQENIQAQEMGYFELKNVKQPVRIFAISNQGIAVPRREELRGKTKQTSNRLAVLPFVNMSTDLENEFFSDGITEELLNALTRVEGLQVTSRTSVFAFKGKQHDIRDIGIQLNVDKILEGSVRKAGNRVRITAQLINAADGYHIWSETYDRNLTDIFEVQDEISGIIANRMRENLEAGKQDEVLVKPETSDMEAYTLFLKGLHFLNKITPADTRKAIEYFEQAIALDPAYSKAYALNAGAYAQLGAAGQMIPEKAFKVVHEMADRSIELDPEIGEGYIAKASIYLFYEWNWEKGFEALQKGIELNPSITEAYELLGMYYITMGKIQEAVETLEKALQLDPLSPSIILSLGSMYTFAERYDDAIAQAEKILEIHPKMRAAIELKGWAYAMKGDWDTAIRLFEDVHRLTNHPLKGLMGLGYSYGRTGQTDKAMEVIRKMEQRAIEEPESVIDADLAGVWFGMGNYDKTFEYLSACVDKRMGPVGYFLQYPAYKGIGKDPRINALKSRMNL